MEKDRTVIQQTMSQERHLVDINAPCHIKDEKIEIRNIKCTTCNGNGYFWKDEGKDYCETPCKSCHGSGIVKAEIHIKWSPDVK